MSGAAGVIALVEAAIASPSLLSLDLSGNAGLLTQWNMADLKNEDLPRQWEFVQMTASKLMFYKHLHTGEFQTDLERAMRPLGICWAPALQVGHNYRSMTI